MTAHTDDDVTAAAKAISEAWRNMHTNEALGYQRMLARHALVAVAPAIAARALREAARLLREAAESFPLDESGLTLAAELLDRERARAERVGE